MSYTQMPDEKTITSVLTAFARKDFFALQVKATGRMEFHHLLQHSIMTLASRIDMFATKEYPLTNYDGNGRNGLVDVVWVWNFQPMVAIEIDSSLREKSVRKLLAFQVPLRFWLYYGKHDHNLTVKKFDPTGSITVVRLPPVKF